MESLRIASINLQTTDVAPYTNTVRRSRAWVLNIFAGAFGVVSGRGCTSLAAPTTDLNDLLTLGRKPTLGTC